MYYYLNIHRLILLCCAALFSFHGYSQDITDTRRTTESFKRLPGSEVRSEIASFSFGGITESANAPELRKIAPTVVSRDSMIIEGDGFFVKILQEPFDPKAHKITYDSDEKTPIRIDRKPYYGDYGKMPLKSISSIVLVIRGDTVAIPPAAYADLKNMRFSYVLNGVERTSNGLFISKDGQRVYLYLFSKNNTGNYEVTYVIRNKKYERRVLDYGFL